MQLRGILLLLLATVFWGTSFVAQSIGMNGLGPYTFSVCRFLLGIACLYPIWWAQRNKRAAAKKAGTYYPGWRAGFIAGLAMFIGAMAQQVGLLYTTAGKTAFITTFYIILVPIGAYFLGKSLTIKNMLGALLAVGGLYFLSAYGESEINLGDLIVFAGAFFWAIQILVIDRYAQLADAIEFCLMELIVCTVCSGVLAVIYETISAQAILGAYIPILYVGILSSGVAFLLQILGQGYVEPGQAAILMSFEAVFALIAGWLVLGEVLTTVQAIGCALLFAGVIVTQLRVGAVE